MLIDRQMQSAFMSELHRWISKLTASHLLACPPGDILITMVKETVILYKKEFRKMKKVASFIDLKEMKNTPFRRPSCRLRLSHQGTQTNLCVLCV